MGEHFSYKSKKLTEKVIFTDWKAGKEVVMKIFGPFKAEVISERQQWAVQKRDLSFPAQELNPGSLDENQEP